MLKGFYIFSGVLLLLTALVKFASFFSNIPILFLPDPILGLELRKLLMATGVFEAFGAYLCFWNKNNLIKSAYLAWLATGFLFYRLGLWATNYKHPCPCLGYLSKNIGISEKVSDMISLLILNFLLLGSYFSLIHLLVLQKDKTQTGHRSRLE